MKPLKKSLTDSLDQLRLHPRIVLLSNFIKNPENRITISEEDYALVANFILDIILRLPAVMDDPRSGDLEQLLRYCATQPDVMQKLRQITKNNTARVKILLDILEQETLPHLKPTRKR